MLVKLLNDEISEQVRQLFRDQLVTPVELLYFSHKSDCDTCDEARQLWAEIASLSDKIILHEFDLDGDNQLAQKFNVNLSPSLVITTRMQSEWQDYGIRFAGIPGGYEFGSLIQAIRMVSRGDSGLKPETRQEVKNINTPIQLKVFVTPT